MSSERAPRETVWKAIGLAFKHGPRCDCRGCADIYERLCEYRRTGDSASLPVQHEIFVDITSGGWYRGACECGWQAGRAHLLSDAAVTDAETHEASYLDAPDSQQEGRE